MSTYYEYQDVGVMIAHRLMKIEGWDVQGYHADQSDMMTDYYDPAYWGGIATKNGYTLVFNRSHAEEPREIKQYTGASDGPLVKEIRDKIAKLEKMTTDRGASESEAESARRAIDKLREKERNAAEEAGKYVVVGIAPGHMANPPRCNWHVEKDGIIIEKGTGMLKFARVDEYYRYPHYKEDYDLYRQDKKKWREEYCFNLRNRWGNTEEQIANSLISAENNMEEKWALIDEFEKWINKIDTVCGGLIGNETESYSYVKTTKTCYKKVNKAEKTSTGSIKEGQCFMVCTYFNYGIRKGSVYRIHKKELDNGTYIYAYKLNGKLTKECTGMANRSNYWSISNTEKFMKWINEGSLAWVDIKEVKEPYEKEVVKKVKKKVV